MRYKAKYCYFFLLFPCSSRVNLHISNSRSNQNNGQHLPVRIMSRNDCYNSNMGRRIHSRMSSNLINIETRTDMSTLAPRCTTLALCLMNTQSIGNETSDFVDYVSENKFDLVAIIET